MQNETTNHQPPIYYGERIETFDIMKGIAIVFMVIGHCAVPYFVRNFIYSFHMPLFFLISGYFYKQKAFNVLLKTDAKRLIIPYIFTCSLLIIYGLVTNNVKQFIIATLWGSPVVNTELMLWRLPNIGPMWFLWALFWCRLFFNILYSQNELKNLLIIIIAVVATRINPSIYLPLDILQGLSALPFYYLGIKIMQYKILEKKPTLCVLLMMALVWIFSVGFSHLEMAYSGYNNYLLDVFGALFGCYFVFLVSKHIENKRTPMIKDVLLLLGKYSVVVLCFHSIDWIIPYQMLINKAYNVMNIQVHEYITYSLIIICRIIYAIIIVLIIPKIEICKKIFSIKT